LSVSFKKSAALTRRLTGSATRAHRQNRRFPVIEINFHVPHFVRRNGLRRRGRKHRKRAFAGLVVIDVIFHAVHANRNALDARKLFGCPFDGFDKIFVVKAAAFPAF
jgi:hypothetical protein